MTYVVASVHLLEAVQVSSQGRQVLILHVAEEVLDGQRGHLDGCGGVHDGCRSLCPLLEVQEAMHQHQHAGSCLILFCFSPQHTTVWELYYSGWSFRSDDITEDIHPAIVISSSQLELSSELTQKSEHQIRKTVCI